MIFRGFYTSFNSSTSVVSGGGFLGIVRNLRKLTTYTLYGWGFALLALLAGVVNTLQRTKQPSQKSQRTDTWLFLVLWILPSILYYTFIHMGQQGLVFVFLPALFLFSAQAIASVRTSRQVRWLFPLVLILGNCLVFLTLSTFPLGPSSVKLLTVDTLRQHDRDLQDRIVTIRKDFDPDTTLIVSSDWRFVQYYLPEYRFTPFELIAHGEESAGMPKPGETILLDCPDDINRSVRGTDCAVVFFDEMLNPWLTNNGRGNLVRMPSAGNLLWIEMSADESVQLGQEGITIVAAGGES